MNKISEIILGMSDEILAQAVEESLAWQRTGILSGTIIRDTAKAISEVMQSSYDVSFTENLIIEEAAARFANIIHKKSLEI